MEIGPRALGLGGTSVAAIARGVSSWASRAANPPGPGPSGALIAVTPIATRAPMVVVVEPSEAFLGDGRLSPNHATTRCGETVSSVQKTIALLPE